MLKEKLKNEHSSFKELRRNEAVAGFTLIELVIVIVIIGILALIALPLYIANRENAYKAEAMTTLNSYRQAELAYFTKYGVYKAFTSSGLLGVDIDDDGMNDISVKAHSTDLYYLGLVNGVVVARNVKGANTYWMCVESAKVGTGGSPSCP